MQLIFHSQNTWEMTAPMPYAEVSAASFIGRFGLYCVKTVENVSCSMANVNTAEHSSVHFHLQFACNSRLRGWRMLEIISHNSSIIPGMT